MSPRPDPASVVPVQLTGPFDVMARITLDDDPEPPRPSGYLAYLADLYATAPDWGVDDGPPGA
jgi:hypothetical protein